LRRLAGIVTVVGIALAALPSAAGSQTTAAPDMVCPDMFVPTQETVAPPGTDKNANGVVCVKEADGILIWRDDLLKL
jgi:hypothetical protein